jgi:hypothetical protein
VSAIAHGHGRAAVLAVAGASLGIAAGLVELTAGASIRSWVGNKQDTTGLGVVTIALAAIALGAALVLLRGRDGSSARRLMLAVGLFAAGPRLLHDRRPALVPAGRDAGRRRAADRRRGARRHR